MHDDQHFLKGCLTSNSQSARHIERLTVEVTTPILTSAYFQLLISPRLVIKKEYQNGEKY